MKKRQQIGAGLDLVMAIDLGRKAAGSNRLYFDSI